MEGIIMHYKSSYSPSGQAELFQGTQAELKKFTKKTGKVPVNGGNGSHIVAGLSSGRIYEYPDENSTTPTRSIIPNKDMMRLRYDKSRITEADYRKLADDLNAGKIKFDNLDKGPNF